MNSLTVSVEQRVVCAAIRNKNGTILCSARHYDSVMHALIESTAEPKPWLKAEQGFIDQRGKFLTREEAHHIATLTGQIIRRCGGDASRLFSENLY